MDHTVTADLISSIQIICLAFGCLIAGLACLNLLCCLMARRYALTSHTSPFTRGATAMTRQEYESHIQWRMGHLKYLWRWDDWTPESLRHEAIVDLYINGIYLPDGEV